MTDDADEVVVWPSLWWAYRKYLLPVHSYSASMTLLVSIPLAVPGSVVAPGTWESFAVTQAGLVLFSAAVTIGAVLCRRVHLSVEGVSPPRGGVTTRGLIVYPWAEIVGVELVKRWYGRWLTVTTSRKRFFYLPLDVADPRAFLAWVEWFTPLGHPLAVALRTHLRGLPREER